MSRTRTLIALSDLHLGRDVSYLNSRNPSYKKNRSALSSILKELGPQDELILAGDVLELSLGGLDEVYADLREFFGLLAESSQYQRIIYVPGNHDHHFWRALGEQVHIDGRLAKGMNPPGSEEYPFCFVDERFSSLDPSLPCAISIISLWPKHMEPPEIVVKYPHHLSTVRSENAEERSYLFTHGHFLEELFRPINFLIDPAHLEELEAFNNIWLEACDYHLGQAGRLSVRARDLVSMYEQGGKEAKEEVKKILNEVFENLKKKMRLGWPKTWLLGWLKSYLSSLLKNTPLEPKSGLFGISINEKLKADIAEYIEKYVLHRYRQGKAEEYGFPSDKNIPTPFTFVFGHTHRPVKDLQKQGVEIVIQGKSYPLANTGGWLRTDGTGAANGENAGILVIDSAGVRWESLEGQLE
jgi:UDP-2,3-diacylglucosamine pyrophosphatase LpxH